MSSTETGLMQVLQPELAPQKKPAFLGESAGFGPQSKEQLISEIFTANRENIARKTRTKNPFNMAGLNLLAFHMSDMKNKLDMVPRGTIMAKFAKPGDYLRAFIWFFDNREISRDGLARLEYVTSLQGVQDTESENLRKTRALEGIIGV